MELLVPPRRLGRLLAQARVSKGLSLDDVCEALDGRLEPLELLEVETGRRPVMDQDLQALADLYDVETSTMVPSRSVLTIDLEDGVIAAGGTSAPIEEPSERREVLSKYLALIYSMRDEQPGTPVPLRLADLDVLAASLEVDRRVVEDELQDLMVVEPEPVKKRFRLLRGRLLVPVVGVLVAGTAVGTLVLVPADDSSADDTQPVATVVGTPNPEVHIGDAAVQERTPDGEPGPVQTRN
jgi:transcriptional regulator with XRE-family HTH domain